MQTQLNQFFHKFNYLILFISKNNRNLCGFFFLLIFVLNFSEITQPPVWDTSASIFQGGIFLYENDFSYSQLFKQPGYYQGGPNTHSYSLMTSIIGFIYLITGGPPLTFIVLHLIHFILSAAICTVFFRICNKVTDETTAFLYSLVLLFFPVFLVQTKYMFLEIPLTLCSLLALSAFLKQRLIWAIVWASLAVSFKETGIVVGGGLAFAILFLRQGLCKRLMWAFLSVAWGLVVIAFALFYVNPHAMIHEMTVDEIAVVADFSFISRIFDIAKICADFFYYDVQRYLFMVPDLAVLFFCCIFIALGRYVFILFSKNGGQTERDSNINVLLINYSSGIIFNFTILFYVCLPSLITEGSVLPRYFVYIYPFLLLFMAGITYPRYEGYCYKMILFVIIAFFIVNQSGRFYPDEADKEGIGIDFAVTERSYAYRHFLSAQRQAVQLIEQIPDNIPVYYGLDMHFLVSSPLVGYSKKMITNGKNLFVLDMRQEFKILPECFIMVYSTPWLGGGRVINCVNLLQNLKGITVNQFIIQKDKYKIRFFIFRRTGSDCLNEFIKSTAGDMVSRQL